MKKNFAESLEYLKELVTNERARKDLNEATTRLRKIDPIFFECLGWDRGACTLEESHEGKYSDYVFRDQHAVLIVEAKKEGAYFELPNETGNRKYKISHFKNTPDVYEAIKQVLGYCTDRGVQFAAISNGHQYLIFLASRNDGVPPLTGECVVFRSLEDISDNFVAFWNILSVQGINDRKILEYFKSTVPRPLPEKMSAKIPGYPIFRRRNDLQVDLMHLSEIVIDGLVQSEEEEREFLQDCYCASGTLSEYANLSRQILLSRYPSSFSQAIGGSLISATGIGSGMRNIASEAKGSKKPVVLLGDVGVGKSIYIKNFINVFMKDLHEATYCFYIDCGKEPIDESNFGKFVVDKIDEILREKYNIDTNDAHFVKGVYHKDATRYEKSIQKRAGESLNKFLNKKTENKNLHLKNSIQHLIHGRNKAFVCFLDNLDQRSSTFQEQAYVIAEGLSSDWGIAVFLSLQPQTFYMSKVKGILKSYETKAYTISPPALEDVLERRLLYVNKIIKRGIRIPTGGSVMSERMLQFFEIIDYSAKNNLRLMKLLVNLAGGNIRNALDYIRIFMGSGHVNTRKIFEYDDASKKEGSGKRYCVSDHEFLKAIIFGEYQYFNPDASPIPNLFDLSVPDGRGHFLKPIILVFLNSETHAQVLEGFVLKSSLYDYCMTKGYLEFEVKDAIEKLLDKRLIETNTKIFDLDKLDLAIYLRLTTIGKYCLTEVIPTFVYLEAMLVDVPILDSDALSRMIFLDIDKIENRIKNTQNFLNYLNSQWRWTAGECLLDWENIFSRSAENIGRVEKKIQEKS